MKKSCSSLREHVKTIMDFENKMLPLTKEELKSHQDAKICEIASTIQVNIEEQHIIFVILKLKFSFNLN